MSADTQADLLNVHRTAFMAAAMRAGHSLEGDEPKVFDDNLAASLLEMTDDEIIDFARKVPSWSAASCVLRSRFAEDRLAAAKNRVSQYVVLGAGLDTYALRMGDNLADLIVFEVDDPPLQAWKRKRIETVGLKAPAQIRFTPCDFERTSLTDALAKSGFNNEPTFVSWLGVTQYLTLSAIRETLKWAVSLPKGSEIVLTYVAPEFYGQGSSDAVASAASRGVEFTSYFTPDQMNELLREIGFSKIEQLTPQSATEQYLQNRKDGLIAPEFQRSVSAMV